MKENPKHFPEHKLFEDLHIQWDKGVWRFPQGNLDTYSIWNPVHHQEIAERLVAGERCALYMMGNFGVGELFQKGKDNFDILDKIKQRERTQNLVIFAKPEDIGELIDFKRLPKEFSHLILPDKRQALYPGPMHAIFPVKPETIPNPALIRNEDNSAAFFWIQGHKGYEKLANKLRLKANGLFGGGSLNIHGAKPSFKTIELKAQMAKIPAWVENIDFVIIDEISESFEIGRSHTQISFMQKTPEIKRIGSLSIEKIQKYTGLNLLLPDGVNEASSTTPYDKKHNDQVDQKIEQALQKMLRFEARLSQGQIT